MFYEGDVSDGDDAASMTSLPPALDQYRAETPKGGSTAWGEMTRKALEPWLHGKVQKAPLVFATACSGTGAPCFAAEVQNLTSSSAGMTFTQ